MSTNGAVEHLRPVAAPQRVGQATAIEQSRAIAEVQAQVIVAQQFPRSLKGAVEAMEEACAQPALAGRALFRFPRGKDEDGKPNILSGPSVHLARELARCFGNIQYGLTEMVRDDGHGQSELMAWAWDMESNTRSSTTFIVPHKRDTRWGTKDLTDLRDIYENNANNGGRRMREMIFAVLPGWYVTRALELCAQTNEKGGGKPLPIRIADAVKAFEAYRVSPARIAAKYGYRSVDELTATDVAQLGVIFSSLKQGTVTVAEEFPADEPERVTVADVAPHPQGAPKLASPGQVGLIRKRLEELGMGGDDQRDGRLRITALLAGRREPLASSKELTADEAALVRRRLEPLREAADLDALRAELIEADDPTREEGGSGE